MAAQAMVRRHLILPVNNFDDAVHKQQMDGLRGLIDNRANTTQSKVEFDGNTVINGFPHYELSYIATAAQDATVMAFLSNPANVSRLLAVSGATSLTTWTEQVMYGY